MRPLNNAKSKKMGYDEEIIFSFSVNGPLVRCDLPPKNHNMSLILAYWGHFLVIFEPNQALRASFFHHLPFYACMRAIILGDLFKL